MATLQNVIFIKNYEDNRVFDIIKKTMTDDITIFDIVWDIYPGIISVKFCAVLP